VIALFEAAATLGPIDAVIHNAGIAEKAMQLAEMDAERIARVVAVNVTGTLLVAREAARRLGRGTSLVLLSSAAARLGGAGVLVDYAATKGAVDTLAVGLAQELGPKGIRVNAVRPGLIETEIHAGYGLPDRARTLGAQMPLGRAGSAEEVAAALLWLCSDEASYVSGAILDVAGGR
jgi:NAD(P)-dependent dehydrogenase (short-subunit alcohol dehydrogenase family)